MIKSFIAGLLALSLSVTPAPAMASGFDEEDMAKLVFGLIALGAISSALSDRDNTPVADAPRFGTENRDRGGFVPPRGSGNNNGRFGSNAKVLPRACLRDYRTNYGAQRIFNRSCLDREFAGFRDLPRACEVRIVTTDGARRGWDPTCLRQNGYRARH